MFMFALFTVAGTATSCLYLGAGGCDVADSQCSAPPAPLSNQIVVKCDGQPLQNVTTGGSPSWLHLSRDGKCLFATQSDTNRVLSYERATLKLVANVSSGGIAPVKLDSTAGVLLVANYGTPTAGASVASLRIGADCSLTPADSLPFNRSSIDPRRQLSSHIHTVVADDNALEAATAQVMAADLGGDALYTLRVRLRDGALKLEHTRPVTPGSGPRHIAIHPTLRMAYVVHEMANAVSAWRIHADGSLEQAQPMLPTVPTNATLPSCVGVSGGGGGPAPCTKAAEILATPDGRSVFVSNRGVASKSTNTLAGFRVDAADGRLAPRTQLAPTGTRFPRGVALAHKGTVVLVAGQGSGNLASLAVGSEAGTLARPQEVLSGLATPTTVVSWS